MFCGGVCSPLSWTVPRNLFVLQHGHEGTPIRSDSAQKFKATVKGKDI